jgi:hypothetical protein
MLVEVNLPARFLNFMPARNNKVHQAGSLHAGRNLQDNICGVSALEHKKSPPVLPEGRNVSFGDD